MIELINKRKANEKHFLKDNGNIEIQLFRDNIHYLKNGKYEEISNLLKENNETIENSENEYKVFFNKKNGSIKYIKNDNYLEFIPKKIKNIDCTIEKNTKELSSVLFKDIYKNIDIEYKLSFSGVKENIILNDIIDVNKLEFDINTNLSLLLENNILIAKNEDDIIFSFNVPYMKDSLGEESNDVLYNLKEKNKKYTFSLSYSLEWIKANERKFPIVIDPNYENNTNVEDTYIYPGDTNDTRYNKNYVIAGVQKINNQDRINRALMRFNLPNDLGPADEIIKAELHLFGYMATEEARQLTTEEMALNTNKMVSVHEITNDWNLTSANWNSINNSFNQKIENISSIARSYLVIDETSHSLVPHISESTNPCLITNLVRKWYSGSPNYGIMIKQAKEEFINTMTPMFFSSNYNTGNLAPLLTIEYRNQNGLESYLDYMSQSFTNGSTYVNTFNGNLTALFDLSYTIGVFPVNIGIVYNTNDVIQNNNSIYGKGYKLTYDQIIEIVSENQKLKYIDGDGTIHYFNYSDGKYFDQDGMNFNISLNSNTCVLSDKNGNKKIFTKSGDIYYLSCIKDISEKEINITRNSNNNITKIVDFNSNEININYGNSQITLVSPSNTTTISYENNNLKSITTKDGTTTFSYDNSNIITNIIDVTGLSINYQYYTDNKKIRKIIQYGLNNEEGESYTIYYGQYNSKIIDNKERITTKIYNYYGNLLSSNSMTEGNNLKEAYSLTNTFGNEYENKNKLLTNTIPIRYSKNYFELTDFNNIYNNFIFSMDTDIYLESFEYSGTKAICIRSSEANGYIDYIRPLPFGNKWTISMDIKTEGRVKVNFYDWQSHVEHDTQYVENTGEFKKVVYVADANEQISFEIINEIANANTYIGDIQFEKGDSLSEYNAVDNSDFEDNTTNWTLSAKDIETNVALDNDDIFEVVTIDTFNNKALKIYMDPYNETKVTKTIQVSGLSGDLFYLSFWYKNSGLETNINPTTPYDDTNAAVNNYVKVLFEPIVGELETTVPLYQLNVNNEAWQYFSVPFAPSENYKSITIQLFQSKQDGELLLTNFSLFKKLKTSSYEYDDNGNIIKVKNITDNNIFNYDINNELISSTNPRGKHFKIEHDNVITDRVIRAISSSGISNKVLYDEYGNPTQTKISKDYTEEIGTGYYKIRQKGTNKYLKIENNSLTLKHDYCSNTTFNVIKDGFLYKIRDVIVEYKYITESSNMIILSNAGNNEFKLEKNENASYHIYLEDGNENKKYLKWVEDHFEFVTNYSDIEENYLYEYYFEDATRKFIQNEVEYTQDGRFINKVKDSLLNETNYSVNSINGLITKVTDSQGNEVNYTYNNREQVTKIAQGNEEINYTYNNQNVLSEINQGNKTYKLNYDNFLNITNIKINNRNLVTNVYDENNGNILSSTYGNGCIVSYMYDEFDRVKKITKGNTEYNYLYNNNGNVHKISGNNEETYYLYDSEKRLSDLTNNRYYETDYYEDGTHYIVTHRNSFNINNYYDKDDNIIKQIYIFDYETSNVKNTIVNTFNNEGVLLESNIGNENVKYTYDELLRNTTKKINNSYETKYEYLSIGNRTSTLIKSITNGNDKYLYKYDKLYNITDIYLNNDLICHYTYDNYNELIEEVDYRNDTKIEFAYDNEGNILSKIRRNLTTNSILNTDSFSYNDSTWEDLLTNYNNETITYDAIGNPLSIGNKLLTWENIRQLSTYSENNLSVSYTYNLNGIRTKKTVNGIETDYYLDGYKIIFEKTGDTIINYFYDINGISGLKCNNVIYYYLKDVQGDIIGIINSNNEVIVKYEYDSFGNILSIKDSNGQIITDTSNIGIINPFRYRGYYFDKETGLYYLNARYYNPIWGRFLNADGIIGANQTFLSHNLFLYTSNNYVVKKDLDGNFAIPIPNPFDVIVAVGDALAKLGSVATTLSGAALAIGVIAIGTYVAVKEIERIQENNKKKVKRSEARNNNVYVLVDKVSEVIKYVGRTTKLNETKYRHQHNPNRDDLVLYEIGTNLTYDEARGIEQIMIERCDTLFKEDKAFNQINGVSSRRKNLAGYYKQKALTWLDENEIPC